MADLPKDSLYNIFSRIPIKSLGRLRCVCKQWREHINDPHLANIHVVIEEPKPMHIALIIPKYIRRTRKSSKRFQQPLVLSFLRITEDTTAGIQVKEDSSSRFSVKTYSIQGHCNGLITQKHGSAIVVINPLTKECHELPPMKLQQYTLKGQGLGFDHSTNTFKMVCIVYDKVRKNKGTTMVHVLGTDSWREIPPLPFYHIHHGEAVYANGRLYWLAHTSSSSWDLWFEEAKLVWLDMKKEEFGVIDPPKQGEEAWLVGYTLVDLNGELGFVFYFEGSRNYKVVWILKDEEWMTHCVIDESKPGCYYGSWVVLGCWNKDGDILMCSNRGGFRSYIVYRLKSGSFHRLLIGPEDDDPGEKTAEVRMYQSSLLSIRKWH